tara:strand:+ start:830 stop:1027 length:198 start_codon:yes stop_codon:yes gene_type:complete
MTKIIIYKGNMFASEELMPKEIVLWPFVVEGFKDGVTFLRSGNYRYFSREEPSAEELFGAEHELL